MSRVCAIWDSVEIILRAAGPSDGTERLMRAIRAVVVDEEAAAKILLAVAGAPGLLPAVAQSKAPPRSAAESAPAPRAPAVRKTKRARRSKSPGFSVQTLEQIKRIGAAAVASEAGLAPSQMSRYVRGVAQPTAKNVNRVLQAIARLSEPAAPEAPGVLADLVQARAAALGLRGATEIAAAAKCPAEDCEAIMAGAADDHPKLRAWATEAIPAEDQLRLMGEHLADAAAINF